MVEQVCDFQLSHLVLILKSLPQIHSYFPTYLVNLILSINTWCKYCHKVVNQHSEMRRALWVFFICLSAKFIAKLDVGNLIFPIFLFIMKRIRKSTGLKTMQRYRFLLLTILFFGLLPSSQAGNILNKKNAEIVITNSSKHDVKLIGIRMLNQTQDQWFSVYSSSKTLLSLDTANVSVSYNQKNDIPRIFQLEFQRQKKDCKTVWGEVEYTSDYTIKAGTQKPSINAVIVDKRS